MTVIPFKLTQVTADAGTRSIGYKAPDGCKGDGTCAKRAPARGEPPMGRRRVNIGNRRMMVEGQDYALYEANELNQYSSINGTEAGEQYNFTPTFDDAGNQTTVKTETGIWTVVYNAENRPVSFTRTNADGTSTKVSCSYDSMGRRCTKMVETIAADNTATTTLHQLYLYRGYLQIACCDLMESGNPCRWFLTWDPTQPVATRPLAIRKDGTWYSYGWDLTKNICELFSTGGTILTTYSYTPYGAVTASGTVTQSPRGIGGGLDNSTAVAPQGRTADGAAVSQPIQWSSEFYDTELALVYYNYRHYNPLDGRWTVRDTIEDKEQMQTYSYTANSPVPLSDYLGQEVKFESRPCMAEMRVAYLDYQMYKDDPEGYSPEDVYQMCGGQVAADRKANPKLYENSCALRICMALNASGHRIKGQGERYKKGKSNTLNLLGVEELRQYIYKQWGKPDIRIINSETADFKDWSGRVTGRCGIVFYLDNKTWNAGHVGLIIDGRPYKDPYGDTTGKVDLWFVPCNCKEKKVSSPCACCLENL